MQAFDRLPVDDVHYKTEPFSSAAFQDSYSPQDVLFEDSLFLSQYPTTQTPDLYQSNYQNCESSVYEPHYQEQVVTRPKYYDVPQAVAPPSFLTNFHHYYDHNARAQPSSLLVPRVQQSPYTHSMGYNGMHTPEFVQYPVYVNNRTARPYVLPTQLHQHVTQPSMVHIVRPSSPSETSPLPSPQASPVREAPTPTKRSGPIRRAKSTSRSTPYSRRSRKTRAKVVLSKGAIQCKGRNKKKNERCRNAALMEFIGPRPQYCAEHIEQDSMCLYKKCCASYQKVEGDGKRCKEVVLKEFGFCHKHLHEIYKGKDDEPTLQKCRHMLSRVTRLLTDLENEAAAAKKFDADLYQRKHKLIPKFQSMKESLTEFLKDATSADDMNDTNPSSCTELLETESESCTEEDFPLLYKCQQNIIDMAA